MSRRNNVSLRHKGERESREEEVMEVMVVMVVEEKVDKKEHEEVKASQERKRFTKKRSHAGNHSRVRKTLSTGGTWRYQI